jgi:hypothetical protein
VRPLRDRFGDAPLVFWSLTVVLPTDFRAGFGTVVGFADEFPAWGGVRKGRWQKGVAEKGKSWRMRLVIISTTTLLIS